MGRIRVLDHNMINMIAAGEVIERPASVVKELLENSIDAGAKRITVSVEDGGRKLISVVDDGAGMDRDDLEKAFEPHATSKIATSSDLDSIATLGFRGEALASIASVAQVRAISRQSDSVEANCIEIDCGLRKELGPASGDVGTKIEIRDLFYKLPARRKFLRTANTEMGHISETFTRIALANTDIDMTLINNGREIHRLAGGAGYRRRIADLFSSEISDNLVEASSDEKGLRIRAFLGKPNISRTNNKLQYVFLNGRFIRDKFISHALREAYRGSMEFNRYAVVFLFIEMPLGDYDVNVHPTKIEVRFYNSNLVHSQILGVCREKLLGSDLDVRGQLTEPGNDRREQISSAMEEFFKKHRPSQSQSRFNFGSGGSAQRRDFSRSQSQASFQPEQTFGADSGLMEKKKYLQIHESFILTQSDEGFVVIDQHALHERIMYEDLRRRVSAGSLESQKLLIPESFEVTEAQAEAIEAQSKVLDKLGIDLVRFGPRTMAIQGFPMLLSKADPMDFVRDLLDILTSGETDFDAERLLDEVLNMAACKAAIKAGQRLTDAEMEQLMAGKDVTECSSRCPHGRPTVIKFSISELEKQFKRT